MRESRSSYSAMQRTKAQKKRGAQHKVRVTKAPSVDGIGIPPTQEERVWWARRELRIAINRANAAHGRDALLNAVVAGRRRDLDRELVALERLTTKKEA